MSGPVGSSQWMYASGGFEIEQSLRCDYANSHNLSRTPSSAGNRKTWTWSGWVKRGTLGVERALWGVGESSSQANVGFGLYFFTDDCLRCWVNGGNASFRTTAKYRDTSAWYHVVLKSSTVSPYFNLYVNGEEIIYMNSGDWLESLSSLEYVDNKWSIYMHTRSEDEFKKEEGARIEMTNKELYKDLIAEFKILQD